MSRLSNKTELVTGGRQGIGRAIVDAFVAEGTTMLTCGRGTRPIDLPDNVYWVTTDMVVRKDVEFLKNFVEAEFGSLSILVNNAGIQIEKTVVETTDEDWIKLMGVNAKGVFMACRSLIPIMDAGGSIIMLPNAMRWRGIRRDVLVNPMILTSWRSGWPRTMPVLRPGNVIRSMAV